MRSEMKALAPIEVAFRFETSMKTKMDKGSDPI